MEKESIDMVLVPAGLVLMLSYHLVLLFRILRHPQTTVIGYENHNKRAWVRRMLQRTPEETSVALQVISSSMSTSTTLASLSIALSSLIGAWAGSNATPVFIVSVVYGDTSPATTSVKYVALLICFLAAFTCFVHSAGYLVHAAFLISTLDSDVPVEFVQKAVIRGGNFWALGLRALYFATTLLLWIFGPIPMFLGSVLTVALLGCLDTNTTPLHQFRFANLKDSNANNKVDRDLDDISSHPVVYTFGSHMS